MAFGAMVGLERRAREGGSWLVRVSLAGVVDWIRQYGLLDRIDDEDCPPELSESELTQLSIHSESPVGRLTHLAPVVQMSGLAGRRLGFHPPVWQ